MGSSSLQMGRTPLSRGMKEGWGRPSPSGLAPSHEGMRIFPKKILIIRLSSIGDVLLTTPLIRRLRGEFQNAQIDFLVKSQYQELLAHNPHLDKIYTYDQRTGFKGLRQLKRELQRQGYDLIIDLHRNLRSLYLRSLYKGAMVVKFQKMALRRFLLVHFKLNLYRGIIPVSQRYLNSLDIKDDRLGLELFVPLDVKERIHRGLESRGLDPDGLAIGFAPGAGFWTKRWPAEAFAHLGNLLSQNLDARILLFGDQGDKQVCQRITELMDKQPIDLSGELSLLETAAAMERCSLVVTNDTGLMHMATALKKRVVAIFGPTSEELGFFPYGTDHVVIQRDLPCRPCSFHGSNRCKKGHFKCMREISPEEVFQAVRGLLASEGALTGMSKESPV